MTVYHRTSGAGAVRNVVALQNGGSGRNYCPILIVFCTSGTLTLTSDLFFFFVVQ